MDCYAFLSYLHFVLVCHLCLVVYLFVYCACAFILLKKDFLPNRENILQDLMRLNDVIAAQLGRDSAASFQQGISLCDSLQAYELRHTLSIILLNTMASEFSFYSLWSFRIRSMRLLVLVKHGVRFPRKCSPCCKTVKAGGREEESDGGRNRLDLRFLI